MKPFRAISRIIIKCTSNVSDTQCMMMAAERQSGHVIKYIYISCLIATEECMDNRLITFCLKVNIAKNEVFANFPDNARCVSVTQPTGVTCSVSRLHWWLRQLIKGNQIGERGIILKLSKPFLRRCFVARFNRSSNNPPTHLPVQPIITSPHADSQRQH
jgi:hypothetical protein